MSTSPQLLLGRITSYFKFVCVKFCNAKLDFVLNDVIEFLTYKQISIFFYAGRFHFFCICPPNASVEKRQDLKRWDIYNIYQRFTIVYNKLRKQPLLHASLSLEECILHFPIRASCDMIWKELETCVLLTTHLMIGSVRCYHSRACK